MDDHLRQDIYRHRLYTNKGLWELIDCVDVAHKRILDIGCGDGANMQMLAHKGHQVVGVTLSETEAEICRGRGYEALVADITEPLPFDPESFDGLILSHVLEHLPWPDVTLKVLLGLVRDGGGIYIALPNVVSFSNRCQLLCGRFHYTEGGIMDRTHLRFFDFMTARQLVESAGIRVTQHFGRGAFPLRPIRRIMPEVARKIDRFAVSRWPNLFGGHIIITGVVKHSCDAKG